MGEFTQVSFFFFFFLLMPMSAIMCWCLLAFDEFVAPTTYRSTMWEDGSGDWLFWSYIRPKSTGKCAWLRLG